MISYDGNGMLLSQLDEDAEMELEDIIDQRRICHEFTQGKPHVILAIAGSRTSATKEAREYSSANVPEGRIAEAIIIHSLSVKLLGSVYLKIHKPRVITKMFTDEKEALKWLTEQLEKHRS